MDNKLTPLMVPAIKQKPLVVIDKPVVEKNDNNPLSYRKKFEWNFKVDGEGTIEQFHAYNTRDRDKDVLIAKWQPYQQTLDMLKQEYDRKVLSVKKQAHHIDETIEALTQANINHCPHPVADQIYHERAERDEYDIIRSNRMWTECTLCGNKQVKDETSDKGLF